MDKIDELIETGKTFSFRNNSHTVSYGTYSKASDSLLSWAATVEEFIRSNYGEESSAFKLYQTFDRRAFNGYEQVDFERQMAILIASLKTCKNIPEKPVLKLVDNHPIIQLLKNVYFWTVLVFVSGIAWALGLQLGSAKFDREKSDYYDQIKNQRIVIARLQKKIIVKDSIITKLNNKLSEKEIIRRSH